MTPTRRDFIKTTAPAGGLFGIAGASGLPRLASAPLAPAFDTVVSGGIGNGKGVREALLAGASAAMLGTRFVATVESNAHPAYKKTIVGAYAKDIALTDCFQDGWSTTHRALRNHTLSCGMQPGVRRRANGQAKVTFS